MFKSVNDMVMDDFLILNDWLVLSSRKFRGNGKGVIADFLEEAACYLSDKSLEAAGIDVSKIPGFYDESECKKPPITTREAIEKM